MAQHGSKRSTRSSSVTLHKARRARIAISTNASCAGVDCSKYKLKPFAQKRLLRIKPEPATEDKERVELDAQLAFENFMSDFWRFVKELNREGNLAGVILVMLIRGFGGDEVCKRYSEQCECEPDMSNPAEILKSPPIEVTIPFESRDKEREATFEIIMEFDVIHGRCRDKNEPF